MRALTALTLSLMTAACGEPAFKADGGRITFADGGTQPACCIQGWNTNPGQVIALFCNGNTSDVPDEVAHVRRRSNEANPFPAGHGSPCIVWDLSSDATCELHTFVSCPGSDSDICNPPTVNPTPDAGMLPPGDDGDPCTP